MLLTKVAAIKALIKIYNKYFVPKFLDKNYKISS